jgi:hypothetical protein
MTNGQNEPGNDPTPEQIRERCAEVQSGWSEQREQARRGIPGPIARYDFPSVSDRWLPRSMR